MSLVKTKSKKPSFFKKLGSTFWQPLKAKAVEKMERNIMDAI